MALIREFIVSLPARLLAMSLGITVLPLRSLYYLFRAVLWSLLLGIGFVAMISAWLFTLAHQLGVTKALNFVLTACLFVPTAIVLTSVALTIPLGFLIVLTFVDMIDNVYIGLKSGLLGGMDGFLQALHAQRSVLHNFVSKIPLEHEINDRNFDDFEQVPDDLTDVVVSPRNLEIPNLEGQAPRDHIIIQVADLEAAKKLIVDFAQLMTPLSSEIKVTLNALKLRIEQYEDLSTRLEKVRSALINGNKADLEDEVMTSMEVITPILLVKQYQLDSRWYNIPGESHITDKANLLTWLKQKPTHPLNRDVLKDPPQYMNMPTRYSFHELKENTCYSQELGEGADEILNFLHTLNPKLAEAKKLSLGSGCSLFGRWDQSSPALVEDPSAKTTYHARRV